ncbi:hypothetical protein M2459_001087 [Parabacteroides sp. PF5-5]|uniref:hypothetical protein n=1 Tax=unclassified Parabacteroides TaxID=2649774 RepID=UPI002472F61B|nr:MULTISPECIES: hypothetical protein [unclassified Parabacteroides]MDH6304355.1 hypothetical protein [Parabacteroides sp. PH5-39]MDH6315492.1 hypothetical protein [Parabacteroides sp. PF5-13]MDH6319014.1 hypothetical protein [Parabacteroides sp. PH5-13]MDH6322743.1 hypothetical protein [Parabacteroides sp. PH5-8]MDH6326685.1 hypothetical protein [Parabacteroides sp. PH5-41]
MYYNHQLRSNLQEWRNQLYKSNINDFADDLCFFYIKVGKESLLESLLNNIIEEHPLNDDELDKWMEQLHYNQVQYQDERHRLSYFIHMFFYFSKSRQSPADYMIFYNSKREDSVREFLDRIITPIVNYLHDSLDKVNSLLYILEKYKLRTEWFTKNDLKEKYSNPTNKQYEKVFEDNIRLYLFDQGIDYPFSTPQSSSGRADVVSLIDTEDPLVMEIKVFDSSKDYRQNRIISGFAQIVKYSNDYHKDVGYLVVFNLDNVEIEIENNTQDKKWPNRFIFNGKTYYIIIINLNDDVSASKQKKINKISLSYKELTSTE